MHAGFVKKPFSRTRFSRIIGWIALIDHTNRCQTTATFDTNMSLQEK